MEGLAISLKKKRVLVTGHTGFKGGWLSLWLSQLGCDVCGYSLDAPTSPSLFEDAQVANGMRSEIGDIRDLNRMRGVFDTFRPEVVFHLAAQPLVRASYADPVGTYSTNVLGTVNVLESIRSCGSVRACVVITTDKCYENREWAWGYREIDALGGFDPYSNSKACAELVVSAYRNSYFHPDQYSQHGLGLASVRAGNVIGGGDWAEDRLIPDMVRAFSAGRPVIIRNPCSTRPWQHVLEPLRGYLMVAKALLETGTVDGEAWNFGPDPSDAKPVEWIVNKLAKEWGTGARWELDKAQQPHEAGKLQLDWSKVAARLGWRPVLQLREALKITSEWYRARVAGESMRRFTESQIEYYAERANKITVRNHQTQGVCE
ncbi:MAG: CDP-glucose 4,6-dehydratase [Terracidiphilus sp.]|nr:CDP-glucose 4,6-dehydratase [Terracidiphilus sp.]